MCVLVTLSACQSCSGPWQVTLQQECVCYNSTETEALVRCSEHNVAVLLGHCLTIDKDGSSLGPCLNNFHYTQYSNVDKQDQRYVMLSTSANQSIIRDEMCGPLARRGRVCSVCEEGYGPTVLQAGFTCAHCKWYGPVVYLVLEFGPLTILFLILLLFPVNITSAKMSSFVVYCQVVATILTYDTIVANAVIDSGPIQAITLYTLLTLSNIWNLDFTTFVAFLPPICLSDKLTNMHVVLLKYLSALYPLLLVLLTYAIVQLHARGNRVLVCLGRPVKLCCRRTKTLYNPNKSLMDVFASFILLSYSKLFLLFFVTIANASIDTVTYNGTHETSQVPRFDTSLSYMSGVHLPITLFSLTVFVLLTILPVALLCLYPWRWFRTALNYCPLTRHQVVITMFVEKFQADYCDGLDENRSDTRWLSSLPMVILTGVYISAFLFDLYLSWLIYTLWLLTVTVLVLLVRPHRRSIMTTVTGLLLALLIAYAVLYNTFMNNLGDASSSNVTLGTIWVCLLLLALPHLVLYVSLLIKPLRWLIGRCKRRPHLQTTQEGDWEEPHRLASPNEYTPLIA